MGNFVQRWYLRFRDRWNGLRAVPLSRLWVLLFGAFLLFSNTGYYFDLLNDGTIPYIGVFAIGFISGLNAVLWILAVWGFPLAFMIGMIVLQFFIGRLFSLVSASLTQVFHLHPIASSTGIRFAAGGMFWTVVLGYIFLLRFIRREGGETLIVQRELELAHRIQETLVPVISLRTVRFEIYGISRPSEKVGGDLVDAVLLPGGDLVAYLADIAGHGLPASILMGRLKTAILTALLDVEEREASRTLPQMLERVNTVLPRVKAENLYATFTGFRLGAEGEVFYALAGSPPVLHWRASDGSLSQTQIPQFPLGLLPVSSFEGHTLKTDPGDLLIVATDGILEVCNKASEEFGVDRLAEVVASNRSETLRTLADRILTSARNFGSQTDDQTLLLIRGL